jgi:hypothetical protein
MYLEEMSLQSPMLNPWSGGYAAGDVAVEDLRVDWYDWDFLIMEMLSLDMTLPSMRIGPWSIAFTAFVWTIQSLWDNVWRSFRHIGKIECYRWRSWDSRMGMLLLDMLCSLVFICPWPIPLAIFVRTIQALWDHI